MLMDGKLGGRGRRQAMFVEGAESFYVPGQVQGGTRVYQGAKGVQSAILSIANAYAS